MKKSTKICKTIKKPVQLLSLIVGFAAVICLFFNFYSGYDYTDTYYYSIIGYSIFTDTDNWPQLVCAVLGLACLLVDFFCCAAAVCEKKVSPAIERLARYSAFFAIFIAVLNFAAVISFDNYGLVSRGVSASGAFYWFLSLTAIAGILKIFSCVAHLCLRSADRTETAEAGKDTQTGIDVDNADKN